MMMAEAKMQLSDWLDDLCVRFIINLPQEELMSVERICFQVEEAQWFYEDFVRPQDPDLPSLNLKDFCLRIFQRCPLLSEYSSYHHAAAFSEFLAYKERVPVRGAILLNNGMDKVVLVKGWKKSASWSFPRGKINKDELDLDCAVREVYEETGFDLKDAGLVKGVEDTKYIQMTIREQHLRLYIFAGIPTDTLFQPRTRKEISAIQWYKLSELPTLKKQKQHEGRVEDPAVNASKFYMVAPFMNPLRKWILQQQKKAKNHKVASQIPIVPLAIETVPSVDDDPPPTNVYDKISTVETGSTLIGSIELRTVSDLPEVSKPVTSLQDTSAQLKSLLGILPVNTMNTQIDATKNNKITSDSEYLFSLLKSKDVQSLPKIPSDQNLSSKRTTQSPHLSTTSIPNNLVHPQLDNHFSDSQVSRQDNLSKMTGDPLARNQISLPQANGNSQKNHQPTLPYHRAGDSQPGHQTLPPPQAISNHHLDHQPVLPYQKIGDPQPNLHNLPPYQRTGDPQFASNSQIPKKDAISVPPADKLPLPTLTSHSSTLLSLFKEIKPSKAQASVSPTSIGISDEKFQSSPEEMTNANSTAKTFLPISSHVHVTQPTSSIKARSEHQDKLLTLFRPSVVKTTEPIEKQFKHSPQNLDLLSTSVELSALPSPAHSRAVSNIDIPALSIGSKSGKQNVTPMLERPMTKPKRKDSSAYATVNGPLDVPQFEALANDSKADKSEFSKVKHPIAAAKSTLKILSRPAPSTKPFVSDKDNLLSLPIPSGAVSEKLSQKQTHLPPDQMSPPSNESTMPSLLKSLFPHKQFSSSDNKVNDTHEHKKELFSAYNNPSSITPLGSFKPTIKPSPFLEGTSHQDPSPIITPLTSRSRVGSVTSILDEGKTKTRNARHTPGTASLDKGFLLEYLNNVASGGKR